MNAGPEPWLHVVGIGDGGLASLGATARAILASGEVLVGGERHLAMVPEHTGERLRWRCPLEATFDDLEALRGRRVVVLASGDPMCFGVGELLVRRFAPGALRVLPAPSTFSLIWARLGWPLAAPRPRSIVAPSSSERVIPPTRSMSSWTESCVSPSWSRGARRRSISCRPAASPVTSVS